MSGDQLKKRYADKIIKKKLASWWDSFASGKCSLQAALENHKKESLCLPKKRSELPGGIHLPAANVPFKLRLKIAKANATLYFKKKASFLFEARLH